MSRDRSSLLCRMAGNIAGYRLADMRRTHDSYSDGELAMLAKVSVRLAELIVEEVDRAHPPSPPIAMPRGV